MKIRNGFVSNSSSSSFIIENGKLATTAKRMLKIVIRDFLDGINKKSKEYKENKARYDEWTKNLEIALKDEDVNSSKVGLTFPSCNFETYLIVKDKKLYISTCNNHSWGIDAYNCEYDDDRFDELYSVIKNTKYYNVENGEIVKYSC